MTFDMDPEGARLPIKIDSTSNGEHLPIPLSEAEEFANELAHRRVGETARRLAAASCQATTSGAK